MKKKLNLMNINQVEQLPPEKMNHVTAGGFCYGGCGCGCFYQGQPEGSTTEDNFCANWADYLHSPGCQFESQEA
jgi:hypothetical protein